jgi:hypothetical protein
MTILSKGFLSVIYLRFIITLVKGMFDLQIDQKKEKHKKMSSMNKSYEKKKQHIVKIFYMWMFCHSVEGDLVNANSAQTVLYFFLLMLYKTSTCKIFWLCAVFFFHNFYSLAVELLQYSNSVWSKVGTLTIYIDIK